MPELECFFQYRPTIPIQAFDYVFIIGMKQSDVSQPQKEPSETWWSIHSVDSYSATKRNKGLTQAMTWVNLRNTALRENLQTQRPQL